MLLRVKLVFTEFSFHFVKSKSLFAVLFLFAFVFVVLFTELVNEAFFRSYRKKNITCKPDEYEKFNVTRNVHAQSRIFLTYVHYLDTTDYRTNENLKFFMHFAHEPCNTEVDFVIIFNVNFHTAPIFEHKVFVEAFRDATHLQRFRWCQDERNPQRNTYVVVRKNKDGGDLCANVDFLRNEFWLQNKAKYAYYFFINSSTRGPFLPNYWTKKWLVPLKLIRKNINLL